MMNAAVISDYGAIPVFKEVEDPRLTGEDQQLIMVKASPIKNFDKLRTIRSFYASFQSLPAIVGSDGVGITAAGQRVYGSGITGMMAEKAIISKSSFAVVPDNLDDAMAAALPNAVIGSVVPLHLKGNIKKGDTVLINGATGFTGQLAVQAARIYGAGKVIVTGRNEERLAYLRTLGADEVISLNRPEEDIQKSFQAVLKDRTIDIVLDYLWGRIGNMILKTLANGPTWATKFINLGNNSGTILELDANIIRSAAMVIYGAGFGSYTKEEFGLWIRKFVPEIYKWAAEGEIKMDVKKEYLNNIENVWNVKAAPGQRIVVVTD